MYRVTEELLHDHFKRFRQGRTEWFTPDVSIIEYIKRYSHKWTEEDDSGESYDQESGFYFYGEALEWIEAFSVFLGCNSSQILDQALCCYAKEKGFDQYPSPETRNAKFPPLIDLITTPVPSDAACDGIDEESHVGIEAGQEWAWV